MMRAHHFYAFVLTLLLAGAVLVAAPANAQSSRTMGHIELMEETCLGFWFEKHMEVGATRQDVTMPVYGCDGAIVLQEEVDGSGPIRFFSFEKLTPWTYQHPEPDMRYRMRARETVTDPVMTCRIRIAVRKYFAPGTKKRAVDGDVGPGNPPRKGWEKDAPPECQLLS